jgi:predicted small lipoprotein YifL
MRLARVMALLLMLTGCGTKSRLVLPPSEWTAHTPRAAQPAIAQVVCTAHVERLGLSEPPERAGARAAALSWLRTERLARLLTDARLFSAVDSHAPWVRVRVEETIVSEPLGVGRCYTGIGAAMVLGIGIPFIPLLIYDSHRYRSHGPDVRAVYTLVVTDARGLELARDATEVVIGVEEQELGCVRFDELLGSPHPEALDAAFDVGVRTLLARWIADSAAQARLRRVR